MHGLKQRLDTRLVPMVRQRARALHQAVNEKKIGLQGRRMVGQQTKKESTPRELNELCFELFESFCERRSVVALAYLMHGWPLTVQNAATGRRLLETLVELGRWHLSELVDSEKTLIDQIIASLLIYTYDFASISTSF
jgi:hypothetical protein